MAATSEGRARRIIDYLNDGEELGIEGAVGSPPRSPATAARLSLSRFRWPQLARLGGKTGSAKEKKVLVVEEEEEIVAEKNEQAPVAVSTSAHQATPKCEPASTSGTRHSDLGMGLSLVFLLAKTSDEFNKMVKVRAEMEALLKEVRETSCGGNGHDNMPVEPCNPESTTSSCVTHRNDGSAGAHMEEEQAVSSGTEAASCEKSSEDDECCGRVDGLEDEFHAELERLQVTYGSDIPLFAAEEELDSEPSDDYRQEEDDDDELGEVVADEDHVYDDVDETEYNGVSAIELERRLHELLHERNQERIEELEAALRRAERKLAEKEMEVCLWKDTAKFALRQEN